MTVNHLAEVKRWVLSWGAGAKVVAPKELAEMVREEIAVMGSMYKCRFPDPGGKWVGAFSRQARV